MTITIDMFNTNQRQAVKWEGGPLLVLAGPGSGKTAVLTWRIADLIRNTLDESFRILGLTFTTKAASEMQNRIRDLLGENTGRIQLRTFHSFCTDLLRQHGSQLGLRPDFSIITDDKDRVAILGELRGRKDTEIDNPEDSLKKIDIMFTRGIGADKLSDHFPAGQEDSCRALQTIFRGYVEKLVDENQLDFGSMLHFTRELLTTKPRIARQVRTVYPYVCVDEFQDTNLAQYRVLRLLVPDTTANLFVVADDDQIIFQWNGADPKRLKEFEHDYRPRIIQLPENYRCPVEVVEVANRLIAHNPNRYGSKGHGVSHKYEEGAVKFRSYEDFDAEIAGLIAEIRPIPKNRRESCLVIARSNKLLAQIREAMHGAGVGAEIVSRHQDFASPLMQLMYYSLKLANAPDSRSILNKLCSAANRVNGITLSAEDVVAKAQVEDLTPLRAFFSLAAASDTLKTFAERGKVLLCDSLDYPLFVEKSFQELDASSDKDAYADYVDDKDNWQRISVEIRRSHGEKVSLHVFLQEMDLSPKAKSLSKDCVRLQTVHTAKGVEFDNVFVIGLTEDQFPTYFAIRNGETAIQEERRNCFVAITRSSKNLYLSYAHNYFGWSKSPSRFLQEMGLLAG
ncbi:ATP-dependent helicase [Candidatus Thiosymbion oneisti]|uniref:ATP-dependent helicase n=1 Tax=Candidatus Thiosymbion oneisti TaxID=589554 RepID=UPI000AA1356B|nr:ATP-dependent helicase [Candidatus Thiosymbion oneisti]